MDQDQESRLAHLEAQRLKRNEYIRRYRAAHPERVKQWRDKYTIERANRLKAQKGGESE